MAGGGSVCEMSAPDVEVVGMRRAWVVGFGAAAATYAYRRWHLGWGATSEERTATMPGDDLVLNPQMQATRAIEIAAPRELVWPWLVQMGYRRAGWYSYDLLDNGGERSAEEVIPELQDLTIGDVMPTGPNGHGFMVERMEPERLLVLSLRRPNGAVSVTIRLIDAGLDRTRLLLRLRLRVRATGPGLGFLALMEAGDFVMMRAMMLGIKRRAEAAKEERLDRTDLADMPEA